MNTEIEYILCSTYHDPDFLLKDLLIQALPVIKELFSRQVVILTPVTKPEVKDFLAKNGFNVTIGLIMDNVNNYKKAIEISVNEVENSMEEKIFYMDFDRLIHWINNYPEELRNMLRENARLDFLLIGRTSRAFISHAITQVETEVMVNEFGSKLLGFPETRDIISVCFIMIKELGEKILKVKNTTRMGFYGTWPVYLWSWALPNKRKYVEVEGLEWETPDFFRDSISKEGYEKWITNFQSSSEWRKRVDLMHDCLKEMFQITEIGLKNRA